MFNNFLFNWWTFNQIDILWNANFPQDSIVYNGYWLQNANIIVSNLSYDNWHSINSETFNNPLTDLGWELNYFFRDKTITLNWFMKSDTAENLNISIDTLKKVLWENNKDLDIKVNWTIRRAKASCINIDSLFERQNYNITFIWFSITFRVVSEFFKELQRQTQSLLWQTATFTEEITNRWTVRTNPVFSILLNSVTSVTSISIAMWSNTITMLDTYSASDVIQIDCQNKTVKINSVEVDYTWTFPVLEVWVNSYTFTINWTKNFDLNLSYFNNYL
jgi:hypothetical protein